MRGAGAGMRGADPVGDPFQGRAGGREERMVLSHGLRPGRGQNQHAGDLADRVAEILEMRTGLQHVADRAIVQPIAELGGEAVMILTTALRLGFRSVEN